MNLRVGIVVRKAEHILLELQGDQVFGNHSWKSRGDVLRRFDARGKRPLHICRTTHREIPLVAFAVGWRVGMVDHVAAVSIGTQLSGWGGNHLYSGEARAKHAMGMYSIHHLVTKPLDQHGRLLVVRRAPKRADLAISIDDFVDHLHGDLAVRYVANVAIVQRIEMRDVEQVLNQKNVVGLGVHWPDGLRSVPTGASDFRGPRRTSVPHRLRVPRPDPHETILLDYRHRMQPRLARDRAVGLRRNQDAPPAAVIAKAMVHTLHGPVSHESSLR